MLGKWFLSMLFWVVWFNVVKIKKWHLLRQSDYDVKIHRIEAVWYNHSYFSDLKMDYALYNRTQRAFTGHGVLLIYIENSVRMDVQVYKMMSNEYRFFPITVSLDACKEIERDSFSVKTVFQKTSNITGCPSKKGYYYVHNAVVDYSRFPPFIPHGDYKMGMKFYHTVNFMGECNVYFKISGKPLLPAI